MKYDHLIQAIEEGAEEKLRDFRESKDREIREIQERTEVASTVLRNVLLVETKQRINLENNKKIYSAREQAKDLQTRARHEACLSVFREAEARLSSLRSSPSYEPFFWGVLAEIIESLGSEKIRLHIDEKDEALCRKLTKETGKEFDIITDLTTNGGLNGATPDEKVLVRNTIEDRLARAKERMNGFVFLGLYGDPVVR